VTIEAAILAGAACVIAKTVNEDPAAGRQVDRAGNGRLDALDRTSRDTVLAAAAID
jgi:hypothetical protein